MTMQTPQIAPYGRKRNAPDSIYPLRGADGRTWAERGGFVTQAMIDQHGSYAAARAARARGRVTKEPQHGEG